MSTLLSTHGRVPGQAKSVECTILDATIRPQFALRWSPVDEAVLDSGSDARAMLARSHRVRDHLVAQGCGDLL